MVILEGIFHIYIKVVDTFLIGSFPHLPKMATLPFSANGSNIIFNIEIDIIAILALIPLSLNDVNKL